MHHIRQLFLSSCRTGTYFSPARKVSKSACAVARFPGGTARPSAKTFFIPSYLGQKGFFTLRHAPPLLRGQRRVYACWERDVWKIMFKNLRNVCYQCNAWKAYFQDVLNFSKLFFSWSLKVAEVIFFIITKYCIVAKHHVNSRTGYTRWNRILQTSLT